MIGYFQRLDLFQSFRRFPLSSVMAIVATALAIKIISTDGDVGSEMATVVDLLIVSYFLFLGGIISRLIRESQDSTIRELITIGWFGVLAIAIFIFLPDDYDLLSTKLFRFPFFFFGVAAILHLLIAYVPFISKGSDGDFWEYNRKVFIRIVESGFFSGVLYLAILFGMVALDKLFGVEFDGRTYGYVAVTVFGIFNSIYFLSKFPVLDYDDQVERPLSAFLVFTQFLLIPITIIYMIILYAYGIKILLDGQLPRGWIGHLSLWFSVIGVFTYLLNYLNPRFSNRVFVKQFIRYFFIVLIVPAILLMISLFRRISDYGVTEERYALATIASWLVLVIFLYGILRWRALKWLPISLSAAIAFGLFAGPLSIFGATLKSQKQRLHQMMTSAGLLGDGVRDVGTKQYEIFDQLRFLDDRSDLLFINDWLSSPIALKDESGKLDTSNAEIVAHHFNLEGGILTDANRGYLSIESVGGFLYPIEDYRYLTSFELYNNGATRQNSFASITDGLLQVDYENTVYPVSLSDSIRVWKDDDAFPSDRQFKLPISLGENSAVIYFTNIEGELKGIDSIRAEFARGFLLIK